MIFEKCTYVMNQAAACSHVPRCGYQEAGNYASPVGRWVPESDSELTPADLAAYLEAKHLYENLVDKYGRDHVPGTPWPRSVTRAEAVVDQMKAWAGAGEAGDPLCCQRYGRLHEPVFAVGSCRWRSVAL